MLKYFYNSIFVAIACLLLAFLWGNHIHPGTGFNSIFIASVLAVLEISLSFDNAVVNATKLEKMSPKWQHRFITWGILIAVFGMRFLFPLVIVSIFAKLNIVNVLIMAINDVNSYMHYLELSHSSIIIFGGTFLLMLFLHYFTNEQKDVYWLSSIEKHFKYLSKIRGICPAITFVILSVLITQIKPDIRLNVFISGLFGAFTYMCIDGLSKWLEYRQEQQSKLSADAIKCSGFIGFLYLELIDASFSLDGILGAFALSKDIIIITLGLFIGAMFVRSLTIMLVEKKTLKNYIYLEHGAHWAIGVLAIIMFVSTLVEVPEFITGTLGLFFIIASFISSLVHNKKMKDIQNY